MGELFRPGPRADRSARAFNEPLYAFVDRSGQPFFTEIRRLLIEWLVAIQQAPKAYNRIFIRSTKHVIIRHIDVYPGSGASGTSRERRVLPAQTLAKSRQSG